MLTPEGHVHLQTTPMYGDFNATRHRILLSNAIEYYVDRANEYFPQTIQAEEMPKHIEIFALQCERPPLTLLHVTQRMHF